MARNPAERAADKFIARIDPILEKLANAIRARIARGVPVDKAVNDAVRELGLRNVLQEHLLKEVDGLIKKMDTPIEGGPAFRKAWLNETWPGEGLSLSARLSDLARMDEIKDSIHLSMKAGKSWRDLAMNLSEQDLTKADLSSHVDRLTQAARRLSSGSPSAVREYRTAINRSMNSVKRLASNGAPTRALKAAYQEIITVSKKASGEALNEAIERAATEKARYNADRIARTETAKAYAQGEYAEAVEDDDVIGMGYDLNDRHPQTDICDFHTSVDLYGLGAGRYPLDHLPPYPFHPHCMCTIYKVYSGDAGKMNSKEAVKYLHSVSTDDRKALLGLDGERAFRRSPDTWTKNLRGYEGHKSVETLLRG